jgi:chaperone modulatory protein CbpM
MMRVDAVAALFPDLATVELTAWIERRWVEPEPDLAGGWVFQAIDVARVRLIHDLRRDLDVSEDAIPVVLALLDQIYELRLQLKSISRAVEKLPAPIREQVLAALETEGQ